MEKLLTLDQAAAGTGNAQRWILAMLTHRSVKQSARFVQSRVHRPRCVPGYQLVKVGRRDMVNHGG